MALTAAVPVEEKVGLILSEFQVFEVIKLINSTKSKVPCFLDPSWVFYSNSSNLSLFTSDVSKHVVPLPSIWIVFFVPFDCWVGFGWVWLGLVCVGFVWLFGLVGIYETKNPNRIFNLYSCVLGWNMDKRYNIHKVYIYI